MLRPIIAAIFVSIFVVGCSRQSKSEQSADKVVPSAVPQLSQKQDDPAGQTLEIDVESTSEIGGVVRSIFQDSRGVLWLGGEGDLFRNDGKALTSYDIRDEHDNGVTVKQIIEDRDGNIWCGTTGGHHTNRWRFISQLWNERWPGQHRRLEHCRR